MKRCPECARDYNDDSLSFCLDDGAELLFGPASGSEPPTTAGDRVGDEPQTAILHATVNPSEAATRAQFSATEANTDDRDGDPTERNRPPAITKQENAGPEAKFVSKPLLTGIVAGLLLLAFLGYQRREYLGWVGSFLAPSETQLSSIAVLPFANLSGDKDAEFLSDGIAETLINSFTRIPDLKIAARTSAFRFRGKEGEPKEIGRELGVAAVLTGSVLKQNDNLTVQVDLIDAADGSQVWGGRYVGKVGEIVTIQQRIAADVARRLKLSTTQSQEISRTYTQNAEAYQHYLRGRYHWNKRTAEGLKNAMAEFQLAIDLDPAYALAYSGIADSYLIADQYAVPKKEALSRARAAAEQAIKIDDTLAEAHTSMASVYSSEWRWPDAQNAFDRAIELNPNYPTARHWHSIYLRERGRFDDAVAAALRAQQLDPLSNIINSSLTASHLANGDIEAAERQALRTFQLDPNFRNANTLLGQVRLAQGRHEEALLYLQKASDIGDRNSYTLGVLGYGLGVAGKKADALAIVTELQKRYTIGDAQGLNLAMVFAGLGDKDAAFEWLERDAAVRSSELPQIVWVQPFAKMRDDARFRALLTKMGLEHHK